VSESAQTQQALADAHAELARASRAAAVGAVSASIAHELNQPLGAVVINAQTCLRYLRREPPDVGAAIAAAERVVNEGNRASDIVRQTRELIAKRRTRDERIDLQTLMKEALGLLDRDIEAIGAEATLDLPARPLWLFGDRMALQQAVINLIGNALTAVASQPRENRRLTVMLESDEDHILISVRDTGPGVSPENLHRIFEPFFTTKEGGMGMGLAISRAAIEAHGGTLTARNQQTGGATFECRVPRSDG
jgi:C4-dicarboxylate-specific signal transduction histidine kinase